MSEISDKLPRKLDENGNLTLCAKCGQRVRAHDDTLCPLTSKPPVDEAIARRVKELVDNAPPLTDAQKDRLRILLGNP